MELARFKGEADYFSREIETLRSDAQAIVAFVGIDRHDISDLREATDAIDLVGKSAFSTCKTNVLVRCNELCRELVQRYVIEGEPPSPYLRLIESIRNQNGGGGEPATDIKSDWSLAIKCAVAARAIWALRGLADQDTFVMISYRTCEEGARAAKRLMALGFAFNRCCGELRFEPASERRIAQEIDRRVKSFGGLAIARHIFGAIADTYDPVQERHHIGRQPTPDGGGVPQAPLGYLLQLAAKHPLGRKPLRNSAQDWNAILTLATDFAAVMEVQPYVPEMFLGRDAVAMFQTLREIAIYDTLFCLPQLRPRDAIAIAAGILDGFELPQSPEPSWTLRDALTVSCAVIDATKMESGPQFIEEIDIARRCSGISLKTVTRVIVEVLSHPQTGANQRVLYPTLLEPGGELGSSGLDFFSRPLLNLGSGRYVMLDRSLCAPAFIEALLAPAERTFPDFGSKVAGPGVEKMLRRSFGARGVRTMAGSYKLGREESDCDLVVETADKVIFVEVKKKALTSKARCGLDVSVILDLANSALRAQTQAAAHELRLRQGITLELHDAEGNTYELSLNGREVERVAVSLPDFGSFQDRQVLMAFLHSQMDAEYSVNVSELDLKTRAELQGEFKKLAKLLIKFKKVEAQLLALHPESVASFHHCWFLSVPQLLILLDETNDAESFWAALRSTRGIHMGTLDFYREHAHLKLMKETVARKTKN